LLSPPAVLWISFTTCNTTRNHDIYNNETIAFFPSFIFSFYIYSLLSVFLTSFVYFFHSYSFFYAYPYVFRSIFIIFRISSFFLLPLLLYFTTVRQYVVLLKRFTDSQASTVPIRDRNIPFQTNSRKNGTEKKRMTTKQTFKETLYRQFPIFPSPYLLKQYPLTTLMFHYFSVYILLASDIFRKENVFLQYKFRFRPAFLQSVPKNSH
jgi:hypothetical protein